MDLSWQILLWAGLTGTLFVNGVAAVARIYGWTRLNTARVLGCMAFVKADAKRTWTFGMVLHLFIGGVILPLIYGIVFEYLGRADVRLGVEIGFVHGVLSGIALPLIAAAGRCRTRGLAPGLFGWRLGPVTPLGMLVLHALYGALLGYVYVVPPV